ncbi:hypothetical protein KR009_005606 [Drosophila setifemur]|nr:hypothetical protein KR009_005606 [Drosophila setifemur]
MFRLYKLYSLYVNNMASGLTKPREWCLCGKLPRAVLHIPMNRSQRCEMCGLARRPRASGVGSCSEKDAMLSSKRQKTLLERRCAEEQKKCKDVRVKVAVRAKKPNLRTSCKATCVKCDRRPKTVNGGSGGEGTSAGGQEQAKNKVLSCRCRLYPTPKRMSSRCTDRQQVPSSSVPSASPTPPPPSPSSSEPPREEVPYLVAMAHEMFSKPNHLRRSATVLVSDFIPLSSPITDRSGGAISKRSSCTSTPPCVDTKISVNTREKGGGLEPPQTRDSLDAETELATQFCPFEHYDGPSEDALVVDNARYMLHRRRSLHIEPRLDLPNTRIGTNGFQPRSVNGSTSPSPREEQLASTINTFSASQDESALNRHPGGVWKTPNQTASERSDSSKNRSLSSDCSTPSILQKNFTFSDAPEDEVKSNSNEQSPASIMNTVFWTPKSTTDNSHDEHIIENLELSELKMSKLSIENHGTSSSVNEVRNNLPVISVNKLEIDKEYSKVFSTQQCREWDLNRKVGCSPRVTINNKYSARELIKETISKSHLTCGKGNRSQNMKSPNPLQNRPGKSGCKLHGYPKDFPEKLLTELLLNKKSGSALRLKLNSVRRELSEKQLKGRNSGEKYQENVSENIDKSTKQKLQKESPKENLEKKISSKPISQLENSNKKSISNIDRKCSSQVSCIKEKESTKAKSPFKSHALGTSDPSDIFGCKNKESLKPRIQNPRRQELKRKINYQPETKSKSTLEESPKKEAKVAPRDGIPILMQRNAIVAYTQLVVKACETVFHICGELPKLEMVAFVMEKEVFNTHITEIFEYDPALLYEFRMPDIAPSELAHIDPSDHYKLQTKGSGDESSNETPIAHDTTPKGFGRPNKQFKNNGSPCQPVWAVRPLKYRRRNIQFEELELSFNEASLIQAEEIITNLFKDNNSTQSNMLGIGTEERESLTSVEAKTPLPIKIINCDYAKREEVVNDKHLKLIPSTENSEINSMESNPYEAQIEVKLLEGNPNKSLKEYTPELSHDIRKRIDICLERKLKKMMTKPLKLLNSRKENSVSEFLEPLTNKFSISTDEKSTSRHGSVAETNPSTDKYALREYSRKTDNKKEESVAGAPNKMSHKMHFAPCNLKPNTKPRSQQSKPLRLIDNLVSSRGSELNYLLMLETDSEPHSEPIFTQRKTLYNGLPPVDWQVISLGTPGSKNYVKNYQKKYSGQKFRCPIYKCKDSLTSQSFYDHFVRVHKRRASLNYLSLEDCHRLVEGLPKQVFFNSDLFGKGNCFVTILLYSSVSQESSQPIRDYPMVLLAAELPIGYFFWLVGYSLSSSNFLVELTVCDPSEKVGRSRVIMPRDILEHQDPQRFHPTSKDHLLLKVSHKKYRFQISLVVKESSEL